MGMAGGGEGGEQGTTVSGNKVSGASLSSWTTICNFSEECSPRPSSYISVRWQGKDSGGGHSIRGTNPGPHWHLSSVNSSMRPTSHDSLSFFPVRII